MRACRSPRASSSPSSARWDVESRRCSTSSWGWSRLTPAWARSAGGGAVVTIGGEIVRSMRPDASVVFQNYSLLPWFSALENVRLAVAATFPSWPRARQVEQARRYLDKVGLGNAVDRRPSQLSGGM